MLDFVICSCVARRRLCFVLSCELCYALCRVLRVVSCCVLSWLVCYVLYCIMLCCVVLCCVVLWFDVMWCVVMCCAAVCVIVCCVFCVVYCVVTWCVVCRVSESFERSIFSFSRWIFRLSSVWLKNDVFEPFSAKCAPRPFWSRFFHFRGGFFACHPYD